MFLSALCKDSSVSRNTFYEHHPGIDSLMADIRRDILQNLMDNTGRYIDPGTESLRPS